MEYKINIPARYSDPNAGKEDKDTLQAFEKMVSNFSVLKGMYIVIDKM